MRRHVRAARSLVADLEQRDPGGEALAHARAVLKFYLRAAQQADYLIGPSGELTPPPKPRQPRGPFRWKKDTARDLILRALSDGREMTAPELRRYLEREGESRSRQGMSFVLLQLEREGKVERVGGGRLDRWRAVQLRLQGPDG